MPANSSIDSKIQPQQIFSRSLVESKRLGRTLPAVINGMSASQAHAQGHVEEVTDAETISTGNEESLFVDGDSEDEHMESGLESESPRKRPANGDGPKLDATASPFRPFLSPALGIVPGSSHFPTSQSGKPTGKSQVQTSHAEHTSPLTFQSGPSTQTTPAPVGIKETPKFNFFTPATVNETEKAKQSSDPRPGNEPLKFEFGTAAKTSQTTNTNNSLGSSPFAKPSGATPSVLDQPSTSSAFAASGPTKDLFDKPSTTSSPWAFSLGTSPLFQPVTKDQIPTTQNTELSSLQNDNSREPPLLSTLAAFNAPANTFSAPPKPTVESASPSPTNGTFTPGIAPISTSSALEEDRNSKPPQPASLAPESTTERLIQPSYGSNLSQSLLTSTHQKPSTGDLSQQRFPATPSVPSPGFSTSVTTASALSGSTAVGTISGSSPRDTVTLSAIPTDRRSATLDKLADAMMLGEKGLLQQFVEFTVGPIIQSSIRQLEDEDSWEQARQSHLTLNRYHAGLLIWSRGVSCDFVE